MTNWTFLELDDEGQPMCKINITWDGKDVASAIKQVADKLVQRGELDQSEAGDYVSSIAPLLQPYGDNRFRDEQLDHVQDGDIFYQDEHTIILRPTSRMESADAGQSLLRELFYMSEGKKPSIKRAAKTVYHRDYLKTKNKPYRKYDPKKYQEEKA